MAKKTFGVVFKLGSSSPPSTTIDSVISVSPPKQTRGALDATDHASPGGAMEFIHDGIYDPGELAVTMHYVAGSADDDACLAALAADGLYNFSITANAATGTETLSFQGLVTSYGPDELGVQGKQTATLAIKVSGAITQAATA